LFDHVHIDLSLKLITDCLLTIDNNRNLQTNGCGNETLRKFKGMKSKNGEKPYFKNVNGYKVNDV